MGFFGFLMISMFSRDSSHVVVSQTRSYRRDPGRKWPKTATINVMKITRKSLKILENTLKCSKLISFLGNKKSSLNQNVRRDHVTMQQNVVLHFCVIFLYWNEAKIWRNYSALELFSCLPLWKTVRLPGKKAKKMQQKTFVC